MMSTESEIIVRLDDVGLADWRTHAVISAFVNAGIPLSCQVIPGSLSRTEAFFLSQMAKQSSGILELCQHGWHHANHAPAGSRKYEFGPTRSAAEQAKDILSGFQRLTERLGLPTARVFTPPHDRLDSSTLECLNAAKFQVVSGGPGTFKDFCVPGGMVAFEFDVDASVRNGKRRETRGVTEVVEMLCAHPGPKVGLVLHAAEMKDFNWCMSLVMELRRLSSAGVKFGKLMDLGIA